MIDRPTWVETVGRGVMRSAQKVTPALRQRLKDEFADCRAQEPPVSLRKFAEEKALELDLTALAIRKVIRGDK